MNNNHACLVCLGSNKEASRHLTEAGKELMRLFDDVKLGERVVTKAEGELDQSDYVNQAAHFTTGYSSEQVIQFLKYIEKENGRKQGDKEKGSVPLDIDLLKYDEVELKPIDLGKTYVKMALDLLK